MADPWSPVEAPIPQSSPSITPEDYFGVVKQMYPNAVFNGGGRTPARNAAVGGVPNSMHLTDQALDFNVPGVDHQQVLASLKNAGLPMTEGFAEGQVGSQGAHLHVGWAPKGGQTPAIPPAATPAADPWGPASVKSSVPWSPASTTSASQSPLSSIGLGARDVLEGAAGLPDMVAGAANSVVNFATGGKSNMSLTPFRDTVDQFADKAGLPRATTPQQRLVSAITQGGTQGLLTAGGSLPLAGAKGTTGIVAKALASSPVLDTISGMSSGASGQVASELGAGPWGQMAASFAGGLAPTGAHIVAHMAGVPSGSPKFVQDLFQQRGVDTTPTSDPRSSPLANRGMNDQDLADYHDVLANGTADDIHNFVANTKMAPLNPSSVDEWVSRRDDMVNGIAPSDYADPMFHPQSDESQLVEHHRQNVEDHITQQTQGWQNAPEFEVVHGPDQIQDPAVRAQANAEDANGDALGFLGPDGKVRIFSGRISDPDTANAVTFHEGLGHFGLQQQFGDRLDSVLSTLMDRNVSQFSRDVDTWQKNNPGAYGGDRIRAAEEVLAEASQNGRIKPTWQQALGASVRQFGRKMGLKLSYSDSEVNQILAMSHDAVINGKGSDVAANGFRTSNKFMRQKAFTELADAQRDEPERAMLRAQAAVAKYPSGNTYGTLLEHVGDLTHRMSEPYAQQAVDHGQEYVAPKVERAIRALENSVDRSRLEDGKPWNEPTVKAYADAHEALPVYNNVQRFGRDAAVQLGRGNIQGALNNLHALKSIIEMGKFPDEAAKFDGNRLMRRSQYQPTTEPGYESDPERTYNTINENYHRSEPISVEETRREALEHGISPSQIKDLSEGNAGELAARTYRIGAATNLADAKLRELETRIGTSAQTVGDQIAYVKAIADFNYLAPRFKGQTAEAGRALAIAKAFPSYTNATLEETARILHEHGADGLARLAEDPEAFLKFVKQMKSIRGVGGSNPSGVRTLLQGVTKPYWEQYLNTLHMNMMLSALSTHVKAPIDMATGIARDVIERALAVPMGKLREMAVSVAGGKPQAGVHPTEVASNLFGIMRAVTDGEVYRRMLHAVKTGEGSYVDASGKSMPTNFTGQFGATSNPRIPGVSVPTDLISAQDTFFRSVAMNQHLYSLGAREALENLGPGAKWDDIMTMGGAIARNPTPTMLREAVDLSNRSLLLNNNPLNNIVDKYRAYRPGLTPWERVTRFVVSNLAPFIRVESNNLINRVIQRSPLGFLDPYTVGQLKAGGAKFDIAMTKILYGTALIGMSWVAADKAKNYLEGEGPTNVDKFKEAEAGGFRPRSIHENGRYNVSDSLGMSVNPFDQHNATATMVASMRDAYEEGANKGQVGTGLKLALGSMIHNLSQMSWVSDLTPFLDALSAHGDQAESTVNKFLAGQTRTWVPNIAGQAARLIDPNQHDLSDHPIIGAVQAAIPGQSEKLPIKYSVYGDPMPNGASLTGVHTMIPGLYGNGTTEVTDPTEMELERLARLPGVTSAIVTPVQKTIKVNDSDGNSVPMKLTAPQFEEYQRVAGRQIVLWTKEAMDDPSWATMSDADKINQVRGIQTDAKKAAREALFEQPEQ